MSKVLIVGVDGTVETSDCTALEDLQRFVGGSIQIFPHPNPKSKLTCYCNEEGRLMDMLPNARADRLLQKMGYDLCWGMVGPVILVNQDGQGRFRKLPDDILTLANTPS